MSNAMKWLDRDDGPVDYGEPTYWETRYELDRKDFSTSYRHDWYFEYDKLKVTFESYFGQPKGQRILIVGCGLSTIASQMHASGYRCITAMDISATAIAHMQAGDRDKEGLEYVIGDARKMDSMPDNLFDGVFDKGCADSLICSYRSTEDVADMFHECCRVLRPGGVFLCVSHGAPDARMYMFEREGLQWQTNAIPMHGSEGHFVYVSKKWTEEEIEAAERKRLDELETTMSMRTSSTFSHSTGTRRRGIMHHNRILYVMTPSQLAAAKEKREKEAADRLRARRDAAAQAREAEQATTAEMATEGATVLGEAGTSRLVNGESTSPGPPAVATSGGSVVSSQDTSTNVSTSSCIQRCSAGSRTSLRSGFKNGDGSTPHGEDKVAPTTAVACASSSITTATTEDPPADVVASG